MKAMWQLLTVSSTQVCQGPHCALGAHQLLWQVPTIAIKLGASESQTRLRAHNMQTPAYRSQGQIFVVPGI